MNLVRFFAFFTITAIIISCNQASNKKDIDFKLSYEDTIIKKPYYVYVIVDNSGSTKADNTEKILFEDIQKIFWNIAIKGGGKFWLNFVDENADNNQAKYIDIPALNSKPILPSLPNRNDYSSLQYSKLLTKYKVVEKEFETALQKYIKDSTQIREFIKSKEVEELNAFLETIYSSNPNYSDCFGEINAGIKAVNSGDMNANKIILAFSDLKQDVPALLNRALNEIPKNILVVRIHHSTDLPTLEWINKDISYKKDIYQFLK
jgi:hypothetical protein